MARPFVPSHRGQAWNNYIKNRMFDIVIIKKDLNKIDSLELEFDLIDLYEGYLTNRGRAKGKANGMASPIITPYGTFDILSDAAKADTYSIHSIRKFIYDPLNLKYYRKNLVIT